MKKIKHCPKNTKINLDNELYNFEEYYVEGSTNEDTYSKDNFFISRSREDDELILCNPHDPVIVARWIKNITATIWVEQIPRMEALIFFLMWPPGIKGPSQKEEKAAKMKAKVKAKERAKWIVLNKLLPKREAKITLENYVKELRKIEKENLEREKLIKEDTQKAREKEEGEFLRAAQELDNFPERIVRLDAKIKAVKEVVKEANVDFKWIGEIVGDLEINETVKEVLEKVKVDGLNPPLEKVKPLERLDPWRVIYKEAVKEKVITFLEAEVLEQRERAEAGEKGVPLFFSEESWIKAKKAWEIAREEDKKKKN